MIPLIFAVVGAYLISDSFKPKSYARGGSVQLLAPNGKPSNLTPKQWYLVRTPAFKKWFGDWENDAKNASKIVDENGEPLIVYHGTTKDFFIFDRKFAGKQTKVDWGELGFFFTDNRSLAEDFTRNKWSLGEKSKIKKGSKLLSCFLSISNPEIVNARQWVLEHQSPTILRAELKQNSKDGYFINPLSQEDRESWINIFGTKGIKELENKQFVAFEPNQIKLADGTNTTFDGSNSDIRYAEGGNL